MREFVDFEELTGGKKRTRTLALMRLASIVVADDGDEQAVVYDEPAPGGNLLTVFLHPGDVMFEQSNLQELCRIVAEVKGRCDFRVTGKPVVEQKFPTKLGPTNRIKESFSTEFVFDDDNDDEPANWWKRGDQ